MAIPTPPKLDRIDLPPEPGLLGGWGRKLEVNLLRFLLTAYNTIGAPFWKARDAALEYTLDKMADGLRPIITPYLDRIEAIPNLPPEVKNTIDELRGTPAAAVLAALVPLLLGALGGLTFGLVAPIGRLISQEVDSYVHSARMTPAEAFTAWKRGVIREEEYHNQVSDHGWSEQFEKVWQEILAPLIGVGDVGRLFLRGEIGEGEFNSQLAKRGYKPEEIGRIKTLLQVIPPLGDIIRMAVREAFTPDVVSKFQLHAELPGEMVKWAKAQGLSEEWARAYWAAHWELPSLTMGFRMLHRDIIDQPTMELLIKTHDVSPFWRDKLIDLSYDPYTRVDIRRMYAVGIVKKEEVYRNYRDLGYDHEKATNLTTFTVALTNEAERDLTKTEVLWGYEVGYFDPQETDALLLIMGYDQVEADYYKTKVDHKRYQAMVKETVKYIKQQYTANQIDQNTVYAELSKIGLPAEQMNRYIKEWDIKKKAKPKLLTADRLAKFRKLEVIGDDDFVREMSGLGYSDLYVGWYLESIKKGG